MTELWHVLLTEPQRETTAAAGLVGRRFRPYLPTRLVSRRQGPQRKRVQVPQAMMPGYLFITLDPTAGSWGRVRDTPGVRDFLVVNGQKATLSEAAVAMVRSVEEELWTMSQTTKGRKVWPFKAGDRVRIADETSVWAGLECVLESLSKNDKAVLRLILPAPIRQLTVSAGILEAVG